MIKRSIIILIFLLPFLQFAQDFSALWTGHYSYYNITDVVNAGNKIYAASQNAIFSYDTQTKEFNEITTVNGLSGEDISTIYYSDTYNLLVVGYENGLIEIIFNDNKNVLTVVDIAEKATINNVDKRINHINAYENIIYISTNYGISVFDLERLEFGDTYFIGNSGSQLKVSQTTIHNGFIYAACQNNSGIRKADLSNPNLIDYQNWQQISSGNFVGVQTLNNTLYATHSNKRIYRVENDVLTRLFQYNQTPLKLITHNNSLIVTLRNAVYIYDTNFNLTHEIPVSTDFSTLYSAASISNNTLFIGTRDFGALKIPLSNTNTIEELHPDCPLLNTPFAITAGPNNLWLTFGDHDLFNNPYPLNSRGFSHYKNNTWTNTPYSDVFGAKNLKVTAINPFNNNQVYIGSYFSGLLEVNDEIPTFLHNETNSGLKPLVHPNPNYIDIRISAMSFDENGNLWILNNRTENPLKVLNPSNNSWISYDLKEVIPTTTENTGYQDIIIDSNQYKWIGSYNRGLIAFNENGGNKLIKNIAFEDQNMPSEIILSLALDKRNQLWIGTFRGLRVLYDTANIFENDDISVNEIIIEEDGIAKELLFQQQITSIKVDGSNNKWIGTDSAGLFYLSSDGQKTIHHFTKDNSPLPSNSITDLSIDNTNGTVYIASSKGLLSFKSGGSSTQEDFETAHVYPNPVRPKFNMVDEKIKIKGLSENVNIKITDITGNLVAEAESKTNLRYKNFNLEIDGGTAYWNGKNLANNLVASGVYLIMLSDLDNFETKVLKLMVVR
ncbi:two-component regulator propeller domain-containing protein [Postechiella marina]